jgi:ribosomal protein S18 acetylase RimI-like enzyme
LSKADKVGVRASSENRTAPAPTTSPGAIPGDLVATLALRRLPHNTAELKRFYVRADHQRNGLGTTLLRHMIAHARAQSFDALRLDTTRQSPAAIALFRKHGFVEIDRYNDNPRAEIFMELRPVAPPHGPPAAR